MLMIMATFDHALRTRDLRELPLSEIFDAEAGESLGTDVLAELGAQLRERQDCLWGTTTVIPDETHWIFTTIGAYDGSFDWTEIDISVRSWRSESSRRPGASQRLWTVWVALEVACFCEPDHNIHRIEEQHFEVGSPSGLERACGAALAVVDSWLERELIPADQWRERAGLPLRPSGGHADGTS